MLHIFASSNENGGTTLEKTSPIGRPGFINGLGTVFINDAASPNLNNATSTKQNVDDTTGIVVLATNDVTHFYWHGYEPLGRNRRGVRARPEAQDEKAAGARQLPRRR